MSPDGRYIMSVMRDNGQDSLWLRNVPSNSDTQIVPPSPATYITLRFSPDGNYLYFERSEPGEQAYRTLYREPVLGGSISTPIFLFPLTLASSHTSAATIPSPASFSCSSTTSTRATTRPW